MTLNWVTEAELAEQLAKRRAIDDICSAPQQDAEIVAMVFEAIAHGRIALFYQPVCGTVSYPTARQLLYAECLLRIRLNDCGETLLPGSFIPVMERLGLMRSLDRHVMQMAISTLSEFPDAVLGVNVSATSAVDDMWWAVVFSILEEKPDVADRLIIEITETAPIHPGAGRLFCQRLRQLGCRIAVDDFGVGFGVETSLGIRDPDIIKIDASLIRSSRGGNGRSPTLAGMIALAQEQASQVIVEGVETKADLRIALEAGALWAQGNYLGVPDARLPF
ncbi:hypothetical protein WK58_09275 [Burkholderia ubonensis]|nr:hypothetical protein WK58_09275 [Burkholderia ubonensis]